MKDYAELVRRLREGDLTCINEAADAFADLTRWRSMDTAPTDGRPCYVIGRYTHATAGFPQDAHCYDETWIDARGNELVVWGWMPRPESWPDEPTDISTAIGDDK